MTPHVQVEFSTQQSKEPEEGVSSGQTVPESSSVPSDAPPPSPTSSRSRSRSRPRSVTSVAAESVKSGRSGTSIWSTIWMKKDKSKLPQDEEEDEDYFSEGLDGYLYGHHAHFYEEEDGDEDWEDEDEENEEEADEDDDEQDDEDEDEDA